MMKGIAMEKEGLSRRLFVKAAALVAASVPLGGMLAACDRQNAGDGQPAQQQTATAQSSALEREQTMLFINTSMNKNGNTASMGRDLLDGLDYEQIDLIDYKIYPLGQKFDDDQFEEVWAKMRAADTIIIGTPVYWHTMAGSLKLLIDRMYDYRDGELNGKRMAFFAQGGDPTQMSLDNLVYTFGRVASLYGMQLVGTATNVSELAALKGKL